MKLNLNDYNNLFDVSKNNASQISDKNKEALTQSLDIRKFEIELYWKRATYFWAFIAAAFTGYFAIWTTKSSNSLLLISCLGFLFTFSWFLVNRGSKFWQTNWEKHVDLLENDIQGPLYKVIIQKKNERKFLGFLSQEKAFSVSKINQILSGILTGIWGVLVLDSGYKILLYKKMPEVFKNLKYEQCLAIILLVYFIFSVVILYRHSKSSSSTESNDTESLNLVIRDNN